MTGLPPAGRIAASEGILERIAAGLAAVKNGYERDWHNAVATVANQAIIIPTRGAAIDRNVAGMAVMPELATKPEHARAMQEILATKDSPGPDMTFGSGASFEEVADAAREAGATRRRRLYDYIQNNQERKAILEHDQPWGRTVGVAAEVAALPAVAYAVPAAIGGLTGLGALAAALMAPPENGDA